MDKDRQYANERFVKDTAKHVMTIEHDEGLFRSLLFRNPECFAYYYRISTWPGHLAISGDMGCYVFARLTDMFEFFGGPGINPDYWSQKLVGIDRQSGLEDYDEDAFHDAIKSDFRQWEFDSFSYLRKSWEHVKEDLLDGGFSNEREAMAAAMDYRCPYTRNHFEDFWDHRITQPSFRLLWACHAIVFAIKQYNESKAIAA